MTDSNISQCIQAFRESKALKDLERLNTLWDASDEKPYILAKFLEENSNIDALFGPMSHEQITVKNLAICLNLVGNVLLSLAKEIGQTEQNIATDSAALRSVAQVIVQRLLKSHPKVISRTLSVRSTPAANVVTLRCITAGVLACEESAAEVVSAFDWTLIKPIVDKRDDDLNVDPRTWCCYLFTAIFELHLNGTVFNQFLVTGALPCLFGGLYRDPPELIVTILTKLKERILFNPRVEKRTKVILFNGDTLTQVLSLHNWPVNNKKGTNVPEDVGEVSKASASISKALAEFLRPLCSSYSNGIAFDSISSSTRNNGHTLKIISKLPIFVFLNPMFRDVVSSALHAAPDIVSQYAAHISSYFTVIPNRHFFALIQVYVDLIKMFKPEVMCLKDYDVVIKMLFPVPITGDYISIMLRHLPQDFGLINCALKLLEAILDRSNKFIKVLQKQDKFLIAKDVMERVDSFLNLALPDNLNTILHIWHLSTSDETIPNTENLLLIVKLLSLYVYFRPSTELKTLIQPDLLLFKVSSMTDLPEEEKLQLLIACLDLSSLLRSKFDVLVQSTDTLKPVELFETYKLLFNLYLNSMQENTASDNKLSEQIFDHIENSLIKYGFSSHNEADIRLWLDALVGQSSTCVEFLCNSIVRTITSLERLYNQVIVITRNTATDQPADNLLLSERFLDEHCIDDSTVVIATNIPLAFSRLVLGCIETLSTEANSDVMRYFCEVITQYLTKMPDPAVIANYLLNDTQMDVPPMVKERCRCWLGQCPIAHKTVTIHDGSLTRAVEDMFNTKDFGAAESIAEQCTIPSSFVEKQELIKKILLYAHVDTADTADVRSKEALKSYVSLLKHVVESDVSEEERISLIQIALDHPVLQRNNPFKSTHLTDFIEGLLRIITKNPEISVAFRTTYFKLFCENLVSVLKRSKVSKSCNYLTPFEVVIPNLNVPFECTISLLESLFTNTEVFTRSPSLVKLTSRLFDLLITSFEAPAMQNILPRSLVIVLLNSFEYNLALLTADNPDQELQSLFEKVTFVVARNLERLDAQSYDHYKLKAALLLSSRLGDTLVLRILQLCPENCAYVAKKLSCIGIRLETQARLVAFLLQCPVENDSTYVNDQLLLNDAVLSGLKPALFDWLYNKQVKESGTEGHHHLVEIFLQRNLLTGGEAVLVVKDVYNKVVTCGENPPKNLLTVLMICEHLKSHKKENKLPCSDSTLCCLHIVVSSISRLMTMHSKDIEGYSKHSDLMDSCLNALKELQSKLARRTRRCKIDQSVWKQFAETVVSSSLEKFSDWIVEALKGLQAMVELQYPRNEHEHNETEILSLRDIFLFAVSHKKFDYFMFEEKLENALKVKEQLCELLISLLCLSPECTELYHANKFLAAYSATTQPHDQAILRILKCYEEFGALDSFMPLVWGKAAIPFYGIGTVMPVYKEPRPEQLLALYDSKILLNTCTSFDRDMDSSVHVKCRSDPKSPVYDLRHLLPVLVTAARGMYNRLTTSVQLVNDDGLPNMITVAVAALTAHSPAIRSQAVKLIRIVGMIAERIKYPRLRLFWTWLLDIVCYTLANAANCHRNKIIVNSCSTVNNTCESLYEIGKHVPLSGPVARFIVEAVLVADHPDHPLYPTLMNFMFLFPFIKNNKVPELERLYHNKCPTNSQQAQLLLLRLLSQGIHTTADFQLIQRAHVIPLLLSLLSSPAATLKIKLEAVKALKAIAAISAGCNRLIRHHELLFLLSSLTDRIQEATTGSTWSARSVQSELLASIVDLLHVAWDRLLENANSCAKIHQVKNAQDECKWTVAEDEDFVDACVDDYDGEGYGEVQDYEFNEYDDEEYTEEKSKLRKKRKLEMKRQNVKKAKIEEAYIRSTRDESAVIAVKVDSLAIADFLQCLFNITSAVGLTEDKLIVQNFCQIFYKVEKYVESTSSQKRATMLIKALLEILKEKIHILNSQ